MKTYLVRHNFNASQPTWSADYRRRYGESNEGFTLRAESLDDAKAILKQQPYNLNPFYCTITETLK